MTISLEGALEILLQNCYSTPEEEIPLAASLHRVLARDIRAGENIPGFDRSAMDGYALLSGDTEEAGAERPVCLTVIEELQAGDVPCQRVAAGQAVKIMTGAMLPKGADCVIPLEEADARGERVCIPRRAAPLYNVIQAGEDIAQGQVLAKRGEGISPPLMGVLASVGIASVPVYQKVKVALLSTGNELCGVTEALGPGKIRNSNAYSLLGYCQSVCAEPLLLGIALDDKADLRARIARGLAEADLVISTGGSSVGDYDLAEAVLREMGAEILFHGVGMKPGKPTLAAKLQGKLVISLSGNPAAAVTSFLLLLAPTLKKMGGYAHFHHSKAKAALLSDFNKKTTQRRFLHGVLKIQDDRLSVELKSSQKNSVLTSMLGCDVLLDVPGGSGGIKAGEVLNVYLFDKIMF